MVTPTTFNVSETLVVSNSVRPSTSRSTPRSRTEPLNVRLASSSSSPPTPAITTRLSVRSSTLAVFACSPPLASSIPPTVVIPDTSSEVRVPTLVRDELTTLSPKVVLVNTSTPSIS